MVEAGAVLEKPDADAHPRAVGQIPAGAVRIRVPEAAGHPRDREQQREHPGTQRGDPGQGGGPAAQRRHHQRADGAAVGTQQPAPRVHSQVVGLEAVLPAHLGQNGRNQRGTHPHEQVHRRARRAQQTAALDQQAQDAAECAHQPTHHLASQGSIRFDAEE